ncbi:hypothetical protein J5N97_027844 [Dioscorea zingiberensis]|uniref:Uncharacterized protein n=1 Tax=Dioscorea zingiberensis TaxID=325984 RepID=A0A9D5BXF5_9LILI|nr:hypothetical protein J5N97_027844 [Dioscorea zingiberensis]
MASQPPPGDGPPADLIGMSRAQLLQIMHQMKDLINQDPQLARQLLINNPELARSLFHAQILLGLVQPRSATPNVQQALAQPRQAQTAQHPSLGAQTTQPSTGQAGAVSSSQPSVPARPTHAQPSISVQPASIPPFAFQSQPSNPPPMPQQTKGFLNAQVPPIAPSQSNVTHNPPLPPAPQYSSLQAHIPMTSAQTQQPLQTPGVLHQQLQPPLPQEPRPPSMLPYPHQVHPQMPHNLGYQPSQPMFHSGGNLPLPSSFPQGQPPLPSHPPPQQRYQGSSHMVGADYGLHQVGNPMQGERGAPMPVTQLPGPPPLPSGQMAPGPSISGQAPRPPPLTPDMERNLLQQVISLTPEQINLLPPEQRYQVKQLKEMLMGRN